MRFWIAGYLRAAVASWIAFGAMGGRWSPPASTSRTRASLRVIGKRCRSCSAPEKESRPWRGTRAGLRGRLGWWLPRLLLETDRQCLDDWRARRAERADRRGGTRLHVQAI